jgi:hypothetical protein
MIVQHSTVQSGFGVGQESVDGPAVTSTIRGAYWRIVSQGLAIDNPERNP